jgi:23S rRNA pseudouridine2605 synthase
MPDNQDNSPAPHSAESAAPPSGERIAKLLARAGIASRREVERMIEDGRVKLDGVILTTPATILTSLRGVTVDEKPVAAPERTRLFAFHKPPGLITAERDPAGRPTIYNALVNALPPGAGRVMPVGRLDFSTEGLLLLTNDGEFKRQLELPATGVPRTYRARVFGTVTQTQLEELAEGVTVDGMHYGRIIADMERRTGRNGWVEMTLSEGKNREVRRVLEHLGLEVSRLIRTAYGPFHLGELPRGAAVEIRKEDLERFRASLKGDSGYQAVPQMRMPASAPVRSSPAPRTPVREAPRAAAPRPAAPRKITWDKPKPRTEAEGERRPARSKPYADAAPAKGTEGKPRRTKPYATPATDTQGGAGGRRAPRKWQSAGKDAEAANPAQRSGSRGGDNRGKDTRPTGKPSGRPTGRPSGPRSTGPKRGDR